MDVLDEGQAVRHGHYGLGTVTESDAERTTVEFEEFGTRKFVTSLWSAEVVGAGAGKPRSKRRRKPAKSAK